MAKQTPEMVPVPLPTEIPKPPSLDQIPHEILHSATVEMLIQQNEDLSSRLKVNIRRNSQLEQKIFDLEKQVSTAERKTDNLLAQNEIIKEKESLWQNQKQDKDRQLKAALQELDLMELRYNELYTNSQQKQKEQQSQISTKQAHINNLKKKLEIYRNIRIRAKDKLREIFFSAAQGFEFNNSEIQKSQSSNRLLKKNYELLRSEFSQKEQMFREQLEQLKTASLKSINQVKEANEDLKIRNQQAQERNEELQNELRNLEEKLHEERKNRIKLSLLSKELNTLKNEKIQTKRDAEEKEEISQEREQQWTLQKKQYEQELQQLKSQFEEQKVAFTTCETKMLELARDNKEISAQLDSIQSLWLDTQQRLEKEELRAKSLEKINRELSEKNKKDRIERATSRSLEPEEPKETANKKEIQDRFGQAMAGQYSSFGKAPNMDV